MNNTMTRRIFRSTLLVGVVVLLAALALVMGVLYSYFGRVQESQLRDELSLAAVGVTQSGEGYLRQLKSDQYRITWVAADGAVLYDTQADASAMENHAQRQEVRQALAYGEGESSRYSSTLLQKTVYYAKLLPDGTVLRLSSVRVTAGVLILGGGIGNVIDRVCRGYVVDMFDLQFISYPIFNLADCFVVVGVILGAVYYLWFYDKYDKKEPKDDAASES